MRLRSPNNIYLKNSMCCLGLEGWRMAHDIHFSFQPFTLHTAEYTYSWNTFFPSHGTHIMYIIMNVRLYVVCNIKYMRWYNAVRRYLVCTARAHRNRCVSAWMHAPTIWPVQRYTYFHSRSPIFTIAIVYLHTILTVWKLNKVDPSLNRFGLCVCGRAKRFYRLPPGHQIEYR